MNRLNLKSDFNRNVLTLMTGTTIAQSVPLAISPILTRMYTPQDFGVFGLFLAISSIFGSMANARYELAIMLPETDQNAVNIAALGIIMASSISITLFLIVFVFHDNLLLLFANKEVSLWLYFVPVTVFFTGLYNVLNYFNTRLKNYKDIARSTFYKTLVLALFQITIGLIQPGGGGLVLGYLASNLSANMRLLRNSIRNRTLLSSINFSGIRIMAKRYLNFPKYSMSAILSNALSTSITNILISKYFSITTLGFYSLVERALGAPTAFMGASVGQVFFQHAVLEKQESGKAIKTFNSTAKKLFLISFPIFFIIFLVIDDLFALVFGEDWRIAGVYAKILTPLFFIRFIVVPLTTINSIFEKQKISLAWQVGLLILALLVFLVARIFGCTFSGFLTLFSITLSIHYGFLYFIMRKISKGAS